jgi:polar amino acid transport system substrate-binding protein
MNKIEPDVLRDLAPSGVLRAAINFGNAVLAQRDPASGEPRGVSVDLARELAGRLGVAAELVTYDAAGKVFAAIAIAAWDVAFLAVDPTRAEQILFTAPYVLIEGTYLVRADSPLHKIEDVDRSGVRVAVGAGSAYELYLSRNLKHAQLERKPTGNEAFELFQREGLEAVAGVREVVEAWAKRESGLRVMDGRFMAIEQAMGTLKGRGAGARYLASFIEEMKASGFVAEALQRSGQTGAQVAPGSST